MQYGVFMLVYASTWVGFLYLMQALGHPWPHRIDTVDLLLLSLATFRLTTLLTEEKVARDLRAPFAVPVEVKKPGGDVEIEERPKGHGLRRKVGELILCPWCAGVWIATFLSFFWLLFPNPARAVLLAFAVAAGGLFFQILVKLMDRCRNSLPE